MFGSQDEVPGGNVTPKGLSCCRVASGGDETASSCLPQWVKYMGGPVWVSSPQKQITYINDEASTLLGVKAEDCLGRPCYDIIGGRDEENREFCCADCPVRRLVESHSQIKPTRLQVVSTTGERHWLQLVVIPVREPISSGICLVHCAIDDDRAHAIEAYLERVTKRSAHHHAAPDPSRRFKLTKREREILELLTEDETLWSIAHKLNVSYTTVRNHVQHILAKLGVHSIIEAVAYYLVAEEE